MLVEGRRSANKGGVSKTSAWRLWILQAASHMLG